MVTSLLRYRSDLRAAHDRLAVLPTRTVILPAGPVEYLDEGEGPVVLLVHGISAGTTRPCGWPSRASSRAADGWRRPASGTSAR
ncbi:hypothetical protein ACI3ET_15570 [Ornithinimicrobium sp. LYQ121]|uniref:hypothetical protein n=1 Tax=Ornithinimicrobium sp. LYQ121 TaxID=3378801 RepID=UPI003852136D